MTILRQILTLSLIAVVPAGVSWFMLRNADAKGAAGEVSLGTVRSWTEPLLWIDARSDAEFRQEHVPGALLLNEAGWEQGITAVLDAWEPTKLVVVYCGSSSCDASEAIARRLRAYLGSQRVYFLAGGWDSLHPVR
jgi:rhodanese-related sulfurtransferase